MLSRRVDTDTARSEFQLKRRALLRGVLIPEEAERVLSFFKNEMPEESWWRSTLIGDHEERGPVNLRRFESNLREIEAAAERARRLAALGQFSYSFDRTIDDHHPKCACLVCELRPLFEVSLRELLSTITGRQVGQLREAFAARYTEGCFLAPHLDTHQGRIAFVLNLTKDWRPEFGGLLHLTSRGRLSGARGGGPLV